MNKLFGISSKLIKLDNNPFKVERGHYLIILFHDGFATMSQFGFFNVTGYKDSEENGHRNEFYVVNNLSSNLNNETFTICYNPVTCELKMSDKFVQSYSRECLLIKFSYE